jgi:hypothetical protein
MKRVLAAAAGALLVALGPSLPANGAETFAFGMWGDMPYARSGDVPKIPNLIDHMNRSDIAFSLFNGDFKDGSSRCDDPVYADAMRMFNALQAPLVYVPGDNEWTDCHRTNNGGYDNLERLAYLRRTMFATNQSFGQRKLAFEQQGRPGEKFSENTRFVHGGIVFVQLNVPGSNNNKVLSDAECTNLSARTLALCAANNAEYEERDAANVVWLKAAFAAARAQSSPGIVITIQADLWFDLVETPTVNEREAPTASGYNRFVDAVVEETRAYRGQVLLLHGDTHFFKVDKPLLNQAEMVPNFTRVEGFGSPNIHWVRIGVDLTSPDVFVIRQMLVPANLVVTGR